MSPEERARLAESNARESQQALDMAKRQRDADLANGQKPILSDVAGSVLEKLKKQFPPNPAQYGEEGSGSGEGNAEGNH